MKIVTRFNSWARFKADGGPYAHNWTYHPPYEYKPTPCNHCALSDTVVSSRAGLQCPILLEVED